MLCALQDSEGLLNNKYYENKWSLWNAQVCGGSTVLLNYNHPSPCASAMRSTSPAQDLQISVASAATMHYLSCHDGLPLMRHNFGKFNVTGMASISPARRPTGCVADSRALRAPVTEAAHWSGVFQESLLRRPLHIQNIAIRSTVSTSRLPLARCARPGYT